MLGYALLWWLCFAMLCFFMTSLYLLCSALVSFAMPCHARVCFAMNGYASIGYMLCRCCSRHYKNSGTHELGPPKHSKNSGTHELGFIFLEPESCVPLFFSSRNRAYRYFLEPECCLPAVCSRKIAIWIPIANSLKKCLFEVPLWGGHSRAQKTKNYVKNIPENHDEKSRDNF